MGFLSTLFDPGDFIWCGKWYMEPRFSFPASQAREKITALLNDSIVTPHGMFVGLNSAHAAGLSAGTKAIRTWRNLLFELDDPTLSPEAQLRFFRESGVPFSTAVYTGGKSVHVIVSLEEPLTSHRDYQMIHARIRCFLNHPALDAATTSGSTTTKIPCGRRRNSLDEVVEQTALFLGSRVSIASIAKVVNQPDSLRRWQSSDDYRRLNVVKVVHPKDSRESLVRNVGRWLADQGIQHNGHKTICRCPSCYQNGRDAKGQHLAVFGEEMRFGCVCCDSRDVTTSLRKMYGGGDDGDGVDADEGTAE